MKITPSNNPDPNTNKIEKQTAGNELDAAEVDGPMPGSGSEKSDFAVVLDKVTRAHKDSTTQHSERNAAEHADANKIRNKDEDKVETNLIASPDAPATRQAVSTAEVNSDSLPILHNTDLDSIVTACHVQLAANGQQAVTLELSRSMLEGLRVKISSDAAGRITADFLAANEGIKTLLDSRSSELMAQLRARWINVAEFKSSVAADANERNDARGEQQPATRSERIEGIEAVASQSESEPEDGQALGATYRA